MKFSKQNGLQKMGCKTVPIQIFTKKKTPEGVWFSSHQEVHGSHCIHKRGCHPTGLYSHSRRIYRYDVLRVHPEGCSFSSFLQVHLQFWCNWGYSPLARQKSKSLISAFHEGAYCYQRLKWPAFANLPWELLNKRAMPPSYTFSKFVPTPIHIKRTAMAVQIVMCF